MASFNVLLPTNLSMLEGVTPPMANSSIRNKSAMWNDSLISALSHLEIASQKVFPEIHNVYSNTETGHNNKIPIEITFSPTMSRQKSATSEFLIVSHMEDFECGSSFLADSARKVDKWRASEIASKCCDSKRASSRRSSVTLLGFKKPNTLLTPIRLAFQSDKWSLIRLRTSPMLRREAATEESRCLAFASSCRGDRMV
jgi:hypothetical protein